MIHLLNKLLQNRFVWFVANKQDQ